MFYLKEVSEKGPANTEELFLKSGGTFLFEGANGGWFDGQFTLIGLTPFAVFQSKKAISSFEFKHADQTWNKQHYTDCDPLAILQTYLDRFRHRPDPIPFLHGGAVGYISYDLNLQYEKVPPPRNEDPTLPDIYVAFMNCFILIDHAKQKRFIIYNPAPLIALGWDEASATQAGQQAIDAIEKKIQEPPPPASPFQIGPVVPDLPKEAYLQMVKEALVYIGAGDIFQANLSHRFHADFEGESIFPLYQRLRKINPSPFSAYLNLAGIEIASGSPERLMRVQGNFIETKPIAGTRPRGKTKEEDEQQIASLRTNEKERAEHLMLVDLERNDIGKVACFGTVKVDQLMALETYSHLFHLVSTVVGALRPERASLDALKALFPGGTITGVPKVRCMQIISELEKSARGLYTGSIGYIDFSGGIDFNIVIRTFIRRGAELSFQVGAGIVADSDPEMEYQETLDKAAALLKALET